MKIYQLFGTYPMFYQPYIAPVTEELQKLQDFDLLVVAYSGVPDKIKGIHILPKYWYRFLYTKIHNTFGRKYRNLDYLEIKSLKEKVDIVHLQHSFLFLKITNLLKLPKEVRPKVIITLRGGDTYVKPWTDKKLKNFYKNFGNKVDSFIVMSLHQKEYLHNKWGVEEDRIHVIPISFGTKFSVSPKAPNNDKMRIVSIFRICWEKNVDDSLKFISISRNYKT